MLTKAYYMHDINKQLNISCKGPYRVSGVANQFGLEQQHVRKLRNSLEIKIP